MLMNACLLGGTLSPTTTRLQVIRSYHYYGMVRMHGDRLWHRAAEELTQTEAVVDATERSDCQTGTSLITDEQYQIQASGP